ncbi:hypothetical protein BFJ63_vAg20454 [Fusarium oxysporum f. sp. narcissi]|uniref:Uncharacterized protein n=1 Tax=Fusarium oxysporum f. sp. narcissi TaxID=451672 RepID=A0A4Q2UWC0_FUSOX|nr:hypothetical protein BFJ63_vAg20454 [Fusarium oxysporum f. sp. narcissi]
MESIRDIGTVFINYSISSYSNHMYSSMEMTNTVAPIALINGAGWPTPLVMICSGSYVPGVVKFVVPFQQYLAKQSTNLDGISIPVRTKLRANTAQPTQASQSESIVPLPIVAALYPLRMILFRSVLLYSRSKVVKLD